MPEQEVLSSTSEAKEQKVTSKIRMSFSIEEAQESPLQQVGFFAATPACLSDWFIQTLTQTGDQVCDVFAGRGTTAISAYQNSRHAIANDLNPLSEIMINGRITMTTIDQFRAVLKRALSTPRQSMSAAEATVFPIYFAPRTLEQIWSIRTYLLQSSENQEEMEAKNCLRFLLAERLLGRGTEVLSISLPGIGRMTRPEEQAKRNRLLPQDGKPEKDVESILLNRFYFYLQARIKSDSKIVCLSKAASDLSSIADQSVQLHFTVPPELNTKVYLDEHWLRLWFFGVKEEDLAMKLPALYTPENWQANMAHVMREQQRTLCKGGRSVWVLADTPRITEVLWPRLLQAGHDAGWQAETEYLCRIPSKKEKKSLQGNIAVRIMQFLNK
jgi:hypothetical protein